MKSKVMIVALLIIALIGAFVLKSTAQQPIVYGSKEGYVAKVAPTKDSTEKDLIADETWLTYTKTGAKLVTYSEAVFKAVCLEFGEEFKAIHIFYKKDRNGPYKEYVILIGIETGIKIKIWSIKNL